MCGDGPSVNLYYSANGQPILISTDATPTEAFEATLVMATMTINDVRDVAEDVSEPLQSRAGEMSSQPPCRARDTQDPNQHDNTHIMSDLDAGATIVPATANTQMDSDVDASVARKYVDSSASLSTSAVDDSQAPWSTSPSNAQGKRQRLN